MVPDEFDVHSVPGKTSLINAAIIAGLYPRILTIDASKNGAQQMRTLANNQIVYFHPSSVNFGRKPLDVSGGGNCLVYFTLM
jgi:ATP-dependent RNA helicase DHX29